MPSNRFFNTAGLEVSSGSLARASHVNSVTDETNTAFDQVQTELDEISGGTTLSFAWASYDPGVLIDAINYPNNYSSYANALEAKAWASGTANVDTLADGVTMIPYSANEKAVESASSASQSAASATQALGYRDKAEEWAQKPFNSTVEPGEYSALHHATRAASAATNAENSANSVGAAEASCLASELAAANSEVMAEKWAENPEDTEVVTGQYSALHWAAKAADQQAIVEAEGTAQIALIDAEGDIQYTRINGLDAVLKHEGDTGAADLPAGTTAQRPAFPNTGDLRFNTSTGDFEGYNGSTWVQPGTGSSVVGVPIGSIIPLVTGYFGNGSNGTFTDVLGNTIAAVNAAHNADGWYVCDGAALNLGGSPIFNAAGRYLPNLTDDRFIQGDTVCAVTGGSNATSHTHIGSAHTHTGGSHYHAVNIGSFSSGSTTITESTMPSHRHSTSFGGYTNLTGGTSRCADDATSQNTNYTGGGGSHNHSVDPPNTNTTTDSSGTTGSSGDSATGTPSDTENRPKFLSAIYVMRVI